MKSTKTKAIVILGLMTAVLLLFSFTPIGTIPIGPLSITLNIIPVAIAAIALGPVGGLVMGSVFGLLSFLQCIGIGVPSGMGAILFDINPFLAFVQRFVPRALDGLLLGLLHQALEKKIGGKVSSFITGFCSAFLNTAFFMTGLVLLFGKTEYVQGLYQKFGQEQSLSGTFLFICAFVGLNAVVEMIVSTIVSGGVGTALYASHILPMNKSNGA
ncbi:MAG: ECF transporter S component [Oscillospiraceae bacterium]|nr:ECF transporter S component [Oscillospiraceae bacterium]